MNLSGWGSVALGTITLFAFFSVLLFGRFFALWLRAAVSGALISPLTLITMPLRGVNPAVIVNCKVMAAQAGVPLAKTHELEAHVLAGGSVLGVSQALVIAHRAAIPLDWRTAAAIDLAGRDILEAIQTSVSPRVIDCPDPHESSKPTIDAMSQDGIQLCVQMRVTVRTNLLQLIGGATESTIVARVGQGIVSAIGSCKTYREALRNPLLLSQEVLNKGLDAQTAFAIVSIDVASITVGDNIGAKLQLEQADADMRIALAKAEARRRMAVALEQEMKALTQANLSQRVLADAAVPGGIALALESGTLSVQPIDNSQDQTSGPQSCAGIHRRHPSRFSRRSASSDQGRLIEN